MTTNRELWHQIEVLPDDGSMKPEFKAMNDHKKLRRKRNLAEAKSYEDGWTKHTDVHWSRDLLGERLDYWPSTQKFRWQGKLRVGGVQGFIQNQLRTHEHAKAKTQEQE